MTALHHTKTRSGARVSDLEPHLGLIRGVMSVGEGPDGSPITRRMYWYLDGSFNGSGSPSPHDLMLED